MMLRDGLNNNGPDIPEGMPEVWKRLSEKVASVRDRICGRIEKALADAKLFDAARMNNPSSALASSGFDATKSSQRDEGMRHTKGPGRRFSARLGKKRRYR